MTHGTSSGGGGGGDAGFLPAPTAAGLGPLLRIYRSNLVLAEAFCAGIPPELWGAPGPGSPGRRAARILRHLIVASSLLAEDLETRAEETRPSGGTAGTPGDGHGAPQAPALLRELRSQHDRVVRALRRLDPVALDEPFEWPLGRSMVTLRDALRFFVLSHESMHLAQLSRWHERPEPRDRPPSPGARPSPGPGNRGGPTGRNRSGRGDGDREG